MAAGQPADRPRGVAPRAGAGGAVALALVVLASGCGGDDTPADRSGDAGQTSAAEIASTDKQIIELVRERGRQLNDAALQLFGKSAKLDDADAIRASAPARAAIATKMRSDAAEAAASLGRLASRAQATATFVSTAGQAFVAFEDCGRQGVAFYGADRPDRSGPVLRDADRTCDNARSAYARAQAEIGRVGKGETPAPRQSGPATRIVIGNHVASERNPKIPVAEASPGAKATIVVRARDVGGEAVDLRTQCAGPLTYTVTLAISGSTSAIDLASAGYSPTGIKRNVPARIIAADRLELDVGTFTMPKTVGGIARVVVVPSDARCAAPGSGATITPEFASGVIDTLALRVRR